MDKLNLWETVSLEIETLAIIWDENKRKFARASHLDYQRLIYKTGIEWTNREQKKSEQQRDSTSISL